MDISSFTPSLPAKDKTLLKTLEIEKKADDFAVIFVSEMLKFGKVGMPKDSHLENNLVTNTFDTFRHKAFAQAIIDQGSIGLKDQIIKSLTFNQEDSL